MNRINGHIDLCEILGIPSFKDMDELYNVLCNIPHVSILKYEKDEFLAFSFVWNKETYFFKYDTWINNYNELVMEEVLADLNILCAHFDLACLGAIQGVISKNYKNDKNHYKNGYEVISQSGIYEEVYSEEDEKKMLAGEFSYKIMEDFRKYNNLEDIWNALEILYKNRSDKQIIVKRIMEKIVQMFLFSLLTAQSDYELGNWEIVEDANGQVDFHILFDNERFMMAAPDRVPLSLFVSRDATISYIYSSSKLKYHLEEFQSISSGEFTSILDGWLWAISEENLKRIIKRIEEKTGCRMPIKLQEEYSKRFKEQHDYLEGILHPNKGR